MRRILVLLPLLALAVVVSRAAVAQAPDASESLPAPTAYGGTTTPAMSVSRTRSLPPLVLPNISNVTRQLLSAERSSVQKQLVASRNVLRFWGNHKWVLAPNKTKCWEVPWQRSCTVGRHSLRLHLALAKKAQDRLDREIPLINDWRTAVRWVQRIYPGTEGWLLSISDREGGWGPWVWYGGRTWSGYHVGDDFLGADTVGGWMQFRYSTFAPYWRGAQKDLRARGYIVPEIPMPPEGGPPQYAGWLSPLAQALTGAYMRYYGKDGCHWCLG